MKRALPAYRRLSCALAAASLGLLTGCGSTVQVTSTSPAGTRASGDGLAPAQGGAGPAITLGPGGTGSGDPAGTGTGAAGATTDQGAGTTGRGSSSSSSSGTVRSAGPESGPGFTRTTVLIGVATSNDYNAFASSTGLKGVGLDGDPNTWFSVVADEINTHGGLLGRKIQLVKHDFNTAQTLNNTAAANQQACTTWTQDYHVFAVVGPPIVEGTLLSCLKKANTPLIQIGAGLDYPLHYQEAYANNPLYFNLAQMAGDAYDKVAVGRLVKRQFFGPWNTRTAAPGTATANPTKVGIISFDDHDGAQQQASLTKQLASHGIRNLTVVACPRSLSDKISCEQSAVLKFASNGITHVINADSTFMNNANSQGYYPRYFLPIEPALFAANVPAKALSGAMSEGYIPFVDVPASEYPGDPSPATATCEKLMRAAGQATSDPTTLLAQLSVCEGFFFVRDAVKVSGVLGASALKSGFERLGSSSPSALTYRTFLGPNNHASAGAVRDLVYRSDIKNFVYVSRTDYAS